jgi:4-hydroxythreonine-4-phosphate dehydrogenase
LKTIAITLGDIGGIGPEVVRKALLSPRLSRQFQYEIIGSHSLPKIPLGKPSQKAARFALQSLETAVAGCLSGKYAALITGPVHKASLQESGFRFPGQTEWLAHRTKTEKFAMMLVGGPLRVSLVTTHVPIRKVSSLLQKSSIESTIELTYQWLVRGGVTRPQILISALNPHGGVPQEQGTEEKNIIIPAIRKSQNKWGPSITGPYSPDHIFRLAYEGKADAVVCMYHDQGLIPLKMIAFDQGVNVTLGIPFVRTSPDHGTAFDIAGKNKANPGSMIEAIRLACKWTRGLGAISQEP